MSETMPSKRQASPVIGCRGADAALAARAGRESAAAFSPPDLSRNHTPTVAASRVAQTKGLPPASALGAGGGPAGEAEEAETTTEPPGAAELAAASAARFCAARHLSKLKLHCRHSGASSSCMCWQLGQIIPGTIAVPRGFVNAARPG